MVVPLIQVRAARRRDDSWRTENLPATLASMLNYLLVILAFGAYVGHAHPQRHIEDPDLGV